MVFVGCLAEVSPFLGDIQKKPGPPLNAPWAPVPPSSPHWFQRDPPLCHAAARGRWSAYCLPITWSLIDLDDVEDVVAVEKGEEKKQVGIYIFRATS